jgi:hypothetical protein
MAFVTIALLLLAKSSFAASPTLKTVDLELTEAHELVGHLVNTKGEPVPEATVSLAKSDSIVARTTTNLQGVFRFKLPTNRGGVYVVSSEHSAMACRVWRGGVAPPSAKRQLLLLNQSVQRGQLSQNAGNYFGNSPFANGGSGSGAMYGGGEIIEGDSMACETCGEVEGCGCHRRKLLSKLRCRKCRGGHCCGGCMCCFGGKASVVALGAGIIYLAIDEDDAS